MKVNKQYHKILMVVFAAMILSGFSLILNSSSVSATTRNYSNSFGKLDGNNYWTIKETVTNNNALFCPGKKGKELEKCQQNYYITKVCGREHRADKDWRKCGNDGEKIDVRRANWVRARGYNGKLECYTGEWFTDPDNPDKVKAEAGGNVRRNTAKGVSDNEAKSICAHAKVGGAIFNKADNGKSGGSWGGHTWHFPTIFVYSIRALDSSNNLIGGAGSGRYLNYGYCGSDADHGTEAESHIDAAKARVTSINNTKCTINIQFYFDMDSKSQDLIGSPSKELPYVCPANFSGATSLSSVAPSSTELISGTRYRITGSGSDITKVDFKHTIKRTDGNAGAATGKVYTLNKENSYSGKNASNTYTQQTSIKNENIGVGKTKEICSQVNYSSQVWHTTSPSSGFLENNNTLGGLKVNLGSKAVSKANTNKVCITLERPYNFEVTDLTAEIKEDPVFSGEDVNSEFKFDTDKMHDDWGTPGTIPTGFEVKAVHFLVNSSVSYDAVRQSNFTSSREDIINGSLEDTLRNFVNSRLGTNNISDFGVLKTHTVSESNVNSIKKITAETVVPDLNANNQSTVGFKYCVAAISSFVDFDKLESDIPTSAYKKGFVSNIECRPIAKKPYLQVENSSLYGSNEIKTINSSKVVGVKLGGTGSKTTFGSWSEYFLVANTGSISNTSSGAALNKGNKESALCPLSPLSIGNSKCKSSSNNGVFGKSNISRNNFASAIASYYSDDAHRDNVSANTSSVNSLSSFGNKTVIMIDGDIAINGNIIADNGTFISSNDVSQHIIISKNGNINIDQNVENIDAWLIAPEGTIRTCTENGKDYDNNKLSSVSCNRPLTINGLVAAKNLSFKRTHGMETDISNPDPNRGNLAAEKIIFNPTAYLWSYQQATSKTGQANIVYTHELAPRQ